MQPIDPDYPSARARFQTSCELLDATVTPWAHPLPGRFGEPLGIDVVELGNPEAKQVLMICSATHGVEGYAGSALQSAWLASNPSIDPAIRVVLVHGVNPHGFSFDRRVNEDNVDLNRNFIDWAEPAPANNEYDAIAELLVPSLWTEEAQRTSTEALLNLIVEHGLEAMQATLSSGQYQHPNGIFYGGDGPTWSHRALHEIIDRYLGTAQQAVIVDLHTGLGPWSHGELISPWPESSPEFKRAQQLWGEVGSVVDGTSVSSAVSGDWFTQAHHWLGNTEVTAVALEFGTVDSTQVLQALRADAWRSSVTEVDDDLSEQIRLDLRSAFLDDSAEWAEALWRRFLVVTNSALGAMS
ncbi:MAG: DUF2817 domain-containing protein [Acidimicrobiales bacterium]